MISRGSLCEVNMNIIQPALNLHETTGFSRPYGSSFSTTSTMRVDACLIARIGWCHRQAMNALTTEEMEEWWAEEQGLIDALLHRDCTYEYEGRPVLCERYVMGLADGKALIQTAKVRPTCHHRYSAS